jgi:NADH-quinone oxidoreductase subunit L
MYRSKGLAGDERLARNNRGLIHTLGNNYWVDELYDAAIVGPLHRVSMFSWKVIDAIVDGTLALMGYVAAATGDLMRFIQTGNVRNYALMLFLGVMLFIWVWA